MAVALGLPHRPWNQVVFKVGPAARVVERDGARFDPLVEHGQHGDFVVRAGNHRGTGVVGENDVALPATGQKAERRAGIETAPALTVDDLQVVHRGGQLGAGGEAQGGSLKQRRRVSADITVPVSGQSQRRGRKPLA
jgi:hypothetical protein